MSYRCSVCGYVHDDGCPEICPKCGAGKDAFYDDEDQVLVDPLHEMEEEQDLDNPKPQDI